MLLLPPTLWFNRISPRSLCPPPQPLQGRAPLSAQAPRVSGAKFPPSMFRQVLGQGRTGSAEHAQTRGSSCPQHLSCLKMPPAPREEPAWGSAVATGPRPTRGCLRSPCPSV